MADAIVYDLLKQLGSIAVQQAQQKINLIVGVEDEVQKLQQNLEMVQVILNNTEERQVTDPAVKLWFGKLKDAYYMMDDVLDTWNTARIKSQIQKEEGEKPADSNAPALKKKVRCFFPSLSCCFGQVDNLSLRHDIGYKIKELNETLDKIFQDRMTYGFDLTRQSVQMERPKTTSFVDVSNITGRDEDRDNLVYNLLGNGSQEERNLGVISVVGMGGIGKSTLAQLAYNHSAVQAHFQIRMWVCVSEPFDQCKVAQAIIQEINSKHESLNKVTEFQTLLCEIHNLIREKKFFLVLDDVWTEDFTKWEPFRNVLICGAQGSRILVTTRKNNVAEMMGSSHMINLGKLNEEDSWMLFSKLVFSNKDLEQHKDLEDLGRKLAHKCKGLPLAIKTLGRVMHNKRRREQWQTILDSGLWQLEDFEKGLLPPLLLSYFELPLIVRRCFSYCAIFPKDYPFDRDELVIQWMALGCIESKANMEMEIIVEEYLENLAERSFFQDFEKDEDDGKIIRCKMHDIVHDFAQSITKNECFEINGDKKLEIDLKSARHLSLHISKETQSLEPVYHAKNLRTLFLHSSFVYYNDFSMFLSNSFQHFRFLRTLILDCPIEKLPCAVESLIHLRCLLISKKVRIEELPETMCNLCNLQTLSIYHGIKKLPRGMSKLINLRHLNLYGEKVVFPKGIGRLTCLRMLSDFSIVGKDDKEGCRLGELKNLNKLRGTLRIYGLRNVEDVREIENAQLKMKMHLFGLELEFGLVPEIEEVEERRRMENDVLFLNALEPHPELEYLQISEYMGTQCPSWMISLTKLKKLDIFWCPKVELLPPLGKLPFLESLSIWHTGSMKVGIEFLGIEFKNKNKKDNKDEIIIFPKLKSLKFWYFFEWEEWIGIEGMREEEEGNGSLTIMPCLRYLEIYKCYKLKSLPEFLRTIPLKDLEMIGSNLLQERCKRETGDEWPKISHIQNIRINRQYVQKDGQLPFDSD